MSVNRPDFLAIGHITRDLHEGRVVAGGSALYSAVTAKRLGKTTAVVTASSDEFDSLEALTGIDTVYTEADGTTTFINTYAEGGRRSQVIKETASPLEVGRIPLTWLSAMVIHVCPVVHEVERSCLEALASPLVGVSPQGWLRSWDASGRVTDTRWPEETKRPALDAARILFFSEEEFALNRDDLDLYRRSVELVAVTKGDRGARIYQGRDMFEVPAVTVREVDPTGAGDVFATAFLIRFEETGDAYNSACFACCTASYSVEREGIDGIPDRAQVEARLREMPSRRERAG